MRRLGRLLAHRFVAVPLGLAAVIIAWNIYVSLHANGLIAGEVVNAEGRPVADATVTLYRLNFITEVESARTSTDASGHFHFTDNRSHLIELQASAEGQGRSPRITVRLWFRAQDRRLNQPLRLSGSAPPA